MKKIAKSASTKCFVTFLYWLTFVGCPHLGTESRPHEIWDGNAGFYCHMDWNQYQEMTSNGQDRMKFSKMKHLDRNYQAHLLEQGGQIQESIWALSLSDHASDLQLSRAKMDQLTHQLQHLTGFVISDKQLGGTTPKSLIEFPNGVSAVFKHQENSDSNEGRWWSDTEAEVAAYNLSQALNFQMVPITLRRIIQGQSGILQYFMKSSEPGKPEHVNAENFIELKVFDYLTGNIDRKIDNFLYIRPLNRVVAIDNGAGFKEDKECGPPEQILEFLHHHPEVWAKIKQVDPKAVEHALENHVSRKIIRTIMKRFERLLH